MAFKETNPNGRDTGFSGIVIPKIDYLETSQGQQILIEKFKDRTLEMIGREIASHMIQRARAAREKISTRSAPAAAGVATGTGRINHV